MFVAKRRLSWHVPDMQRNSIGISDIRVYVPEPALGVTTLVAERIREFPHLDRHLTRACRVTGQRYIRFPSTREDTATMAASSALRLLVANPDLDPGKLRYLAVGTESGVDHAKPVSAYVTGMLRHAGIRIASNVSNFEVQHACAAGTLSMLGIGAMLATGGRAGESGLVVCSDIARYETHSTAEVTQGAGSAALLIEPDPKLIELDLATPGYFSSDVDDFFRPLDSKTARVKGAYSMQCYTESLEQALLDHSARSGRDPSDVLAQTDYFVLHTPFRNLPQIALTGLLERYLGLDDNGVQSFLRDKGVHDGMELVAEVGNLYTGAMYLSLASMLSRQYEVHGEAIVGKSILMASYGSGNIMVVFSGRIAESAPEVISSWDLDDTVRARRSASFEEYRQWVSGPSVPAPRRSLVAVETSSPFVLETVRDDGYREYAFNRGAVRLPAGRTQAPVAIRESA